MEVDMAFRNSLGSLSALSLAKSDSTTASAIIAGGVVVTVGAAIFTYKAIKEYERKKYLEKIEKVNQLHTKHLAKIFISDYNEIQGFPAIFKISDDQNTVESLHFTQEEIKSIGETLPHGSDISLTNYREAVRNAILKLKAFYERKSEDNHHDVSHDITSRVITYLLNMLQTKCLNFEGYDYDIAYLSALAKFVNGYASLKKSDVSQDFTRFNHVYSYLLTAKQLLEQHKEELTLEDLISELRAFCMKNTNLLIKNYAKLIVKNQHWDLIDNVTQDELAQDLLSKEYVHTEFKGWVLDRDKITPITDSIFKPWLINLAKYYLETLDPKSNLSTTDISAPEYIFIVPSYERLKELKRVKKPTSKQLKEIELINETAKSVEFTFKSCKNFITTKLDLSSKNKIPQFTSVTKKNEVLQRAKILADFATLIHKMISLQYLCTHLLKSIKQLGEIYVNNPENFCWIFSILNDSCLGITENVDTIRHLFQKIQQANLNHMQLEDKESFPEHVLAILNSTHKAISELSMRVKVYRNKIAENHPATEPSIESVENEMFNVAKFLATMYHFEDKLELVTPDSKSATTAASTITLSNTALTRLLPSSLSSNASTTVNNTGVIDYGFKRIPSITNTPLGKLISLNKQLEMIYERILKIQFDEKPKTTDKEILQQFNNEINAYKNLYEKLVNLQDKSELLIREENKDEERSIKANKMLDLTISLSIQTLGNLQLTREERLKKSAHFASKIHAELSKQNYQFIDHHRDEFWQFLYSICSISIFGTNTRSRIVKLEQAYSDFSKLSMVIIKNENMDL